MLDPTLLSSGDREPTPDKPSISGAVQPDLVSGREGTAFIGLLTVTVEEAGVVQKVFRLDQNNAGSGYFWRADESDNRLPRLVHRRIHWQTNTSSELVAGELIEDYRPNILILIGTAGGHSQRDGVKLGDVVVADYLDYSGYWKFKDNVVQKRSNAHDHPSAHLLKNYVEPLRASPDRWISKIMETRPDDQSPTAFMGSVVSGNTLLGDPSNGEQKRIIEFFDKALALEMEGYGLCLSVYNARRTVHYNPLLLIVRGISDFVDCDEDENQKTRKAWTPYAVAAATAFSQALIEDLLQVHCLAKLED